MPNFMKIDGDTLIPVRMIVRDSGNSNAPVTNTNATDMKLSDILSGAGLAGAATVGTTGTVTKVAMIPAAAAAPTKAEYDAMRTALINAGLMASS